MIWFDIKLVFWWWFEMNMMMLIHKVNTSELSIIYHDVNTWLDFAVFLFTFLSAIFFEAQTFFSCWLLQIFSSYLLFQNEHFKMFMLSQRYPLFSWFFIIYYFVECWSNHNILFSCVCDNNTHLCENCELWCENWRLNKPNWIKSNESNG